MESRFEIGDKVTIRSTYHSGCTSSDYPNSFTSTMLNDFGGSICEITDISFDVPSNILTKKLNVEAYYYKLRQLNKSHWIPYTFSATMFKECHDFDYLDKLKVEYSGQLKGFPPEIVEKLLERQKEQVGKKDLSVFEHRLSSDKSQGGIDWSCTPEGHTFWYKVLDLQDFDIFFEEYPRIESQTNLLIESQTKSQTNEFKLQKKRAYFFRGDEPKGSCICGKQNKIAVTIGHLSYLRIIGK